MTALTIAVVAKQCLPGRVKTRLTPPLRPEEAARLAQASLDDTLDLVRSIPAARRVLFFAGDAPTDAGDFDVLAQPDGGLDERLGYLFDVIEGPLLLIGMDTPQLTPADLTGPATAWPGSVDAWFGPALDGGFWALAMREPDGSMIRGVRMSAPSTGREQRARLAAGGQRVADLATVRDVDHVEDVRHVAALAPHGRFAAVWRDMQRTDTRRAG
ncbi:TIGR04282 family arsenosugar biosynthesis glycosyltransferase [Microbacterium xanthum]|uniref:TIGR04282 family arsenosugar biosynthesis glycosyltransferase n=1 Tax=Microbacterium xanthum TaxID=3079794 RepID=UPI002AD21427|nr:DUF2064 domain-containing protein [Microbacterium sp. KSW-48]MDZ8172841.1 DUF2064 domain-containing protein [Microbacterium sp. KSW-48]